MISNARMQSAQLKCWYWIYLHDLIAYFTIHSKAPFSVELWLFCCIPCRWNSYKHWIYYIFLSAFLSLNSVLLCLPKDKNILSIWAPDCVKFLPRILPLKNLHDKEKIEPRNWVRCRYYSILVDANGCFMQFRATRKGPMCACYLQKVLWSGTTWRLGWVLNLGFLDNQSSNFEQVT